MKDLDFTNILVAAPYSRFGRAVLTAIDYYLMDEKDPAADLATETAAYVEQEIDVINSLKADNPGKTTILILPDYDDELAIAKIIYHQHFKQWIVDNKELAVRRWPELTGQLSTEQSTQAAFLSNLETKIHIPGWKLINTLDFDLVIDFKTLMGRSEVDLHQVLADFLETDKNANVSNYIARYQAAHSQYFA